MKPSSVEDVIARWNYLGTLSAEARTALVAQCEREGYDASGEQLLTSPPTDLCWKCGAKFRRTNDA